MPILFQVTCTDTDYMNNNCDHYGFVHPMNLVEVQQALDSGYRVYDNDGDIVVSVTPHPKGHNCVCSGTYQYQSSSVPGQVHTYHYDEPQVDMFLLKMLIPDRQVTSEELTETYRSLGVPDSIIRELGR